MHNDLNSSLIYNEGSDEQSTPRRKHLPTSAKQIVLNVFNALKSESTEDDATVIKRVAFLTKVCTATVYKIVKQGICERKERYDKGQLKTIKEWDIDIIRRKVYELYQQNHVATVDSLRKSLITDEIGITCSNTTLWRVLRKVGFRFKTINKRQVIMESSRLLKLRHEYLTTIKKYRAEGRFICYLDETWFDTHDTVKKGWMDSSKKCKLDVPVTRGKRIIILHAGSENGWIGEVLLSAKNIKCSSLDYHDDMNAYLFECWFQNKLLPALPEKSVIVMDNASYHSRQLKKIPNTSSTKFEIGQFLEENNLYFEESYTKKQMLEVLKTKQFLKVYQVDTMANALGHIVLRLPPYYCIFNPIELIWAQLKQSIRKANNLPRFSETCINVIKEAINHITSENWKNCVKKIVKIENEYVNIGSIYNQIIINLQESDSSSGESDYC